MQLEKIPLAKKTEVKPDKVTIYLEEVRERPQGAAYLGNSNCSTLYRTLRDQKCKSLGWSSMLKFWQKRRRVQEPGKIEKEISDA